MRRKIHNHNINNKVKNIKRNKRRKNIDEGITLVALVITIIILLILTGISISMIIGNNGLINKATKAKEQYLIEKLDEQVEMATSVLYSEIIENNIVNPVADYNKNENGKLYNSLKRDLSDEGWNVGTICDPETGIIKVIYIKEIKRNYEITLSTNEVKYAIVKNNKLEYVTGKGLKLPKNSRNLEEDYTDDWKGKYVIYPAGAWGATNDVALEQLGNDLNYTGDEIPLERGEFGGCKKHTFVATGNSVTENSNDNIDAQTKVGNIPAWRVLGKDSNGRIQLMTTYITEQHYLSNEISESLALLDGTGNRKYAMYENTKLAEEGTARAMNLEEAQLLGTDSLRKATTLPEITGLSRANHYWLSTIQSANENGYGWMKTVNGDGSIGALDRYYRVGIRPVVSLKSTVEYSGTGTIEDPLVLGFSNSDEIDDNNEIDSEQIIYLAEGTPTLKIGSDNFASNYLSNWMGKYVQYPAGVWGATNNEVQEQLGNDVNYTGEETPLERGQLGGWKLNTYVATGNSVTGNVEDDIDAQTKVENIPAWKVLGKDSYGRIKLMTTFITEEYYLSDNIEEALTLLDGTGTRKYGMYENSKFAEEGMARAMNLEEAQLLKTSSHRKATTLPEIIGFSRANNYWLSTIQSIGKNGYGWMQIVNGDGDIGALDRYYRVGIRPVVTLKSTVKYSGTGTEDDPFVLKN